MNILIKSRRKPLAAAFAAAFACALPASAVLTAVPASAQSRQDDLDRAVSALRGITTMKADFTQTGRNGQTLRGELTLKNPGRIRFEYSDGANMLVVSDGRALRLIDYDVQQVEAWPISNSPLGALLDPNRDVRRYGKLLPTTNSNVISIEVSDPGRPEYGTMTLVFVRNGSAPGGLQLTSWVALDAQNTRTTVRLSNQRYGMTVNNSAFSYRDPRPRTRRP
ncbi:outer membrane lipoprotein carrier protein LolA [Aurantiacibacter xanthus]|uniref:Outer membrane lipoprotein carrier protein LolA n=1 Tax=Aurantiacibacter xanthus TaxID=1784712 RepID=A0A3A1P430_9SPHN|nr:outer membrane lipoprotein carrier protein LolA [Aurantiacibacter xanthus]RIV83545.1 outer membrane lipoprotein carrier protein LolA [Aurantiacibacter xanthus]